MASVSRRTRRAVLPVLVSRTATARLRPSCAEGGVLGVICGIIATFKPRSHQTHHRKGKPLMGRFAPLRRDGHELPGIQIPKDPNCPLCGKNPTITKLIDYLEFCGIGRGEEGGSSGDSIVTKRKKARPRRHQRRDPPRKMRDAKEDFVLIDRPQP